MSVMAGTIAPGVCLMIDLILNKIRIPLRHLIINILISIAYIFITFLGQVLYEYPIYANNIAWNYKLNSSIAVVFNNSQNVTEGQIYKNCQNYDKNVKNLTASYYSSFNVPGLNYSLCTQNYNLTDIGPKDYDQFKNCYLIVSIIILGSFISFIMSYFLHKLKSSNSKPYKGPTKK